MDDLPGQQGNWMQTFTGRAFYPLAPRVEDVDPIDIAHALSMICRYGGHTTRFYSVAEHCVLLSEAVSPDNALWALLHDATEAYVGDMVRPLKKNMPTYCKAEDNIMRVICSRFGLEGKCPDEIKAFDTRILCDEREALMNPSEKNWTLLYGLVPLGVVIEGWLPWEAERRFLKRLRELTA